MFFAPTAGGLAASFPPSPQEIDCGNGTVVKIPPPPPQQQGKPSHNPPDMDAADALVAATAHRVWPSARLLARAMHSKEDIVSLEGLSVLELGAGCGLPGMAAWRAGAARVLLTDLPENLQRIRDVIAINDANSAVQAAAANWCEPLPSPVGDVRWDCVLAADCVFWPHLFAPLLDTLAALIVPGHAPRVLLCVADRFGRATEFETQASQSGWRIRELHASPVVEESGPRLASSGESLQPPSELHAESAAFAPRILELTRSS
jgi:predicted nicotinamide N-methyase